MVYGTLYRITSCVYVDPIYEKIKLHARQDTTTSHTSSHTYASVPSLEHNTQTTAGEGQLKPN